MQWPKVKGQTMIYKTLHRKLKIEQHETNWKLWVHSSASIELAITLFVDVVLYFVV